MLVSVFTDDVPERLIGDKAYESGALDADLAAVQSTMLHRRNRKWTT